MFHVVIPEPTMLLCLRCCVKITDAEYFIHGKWFTQLTILEAESPQDCLASGEGILALITT